VPFEGPLVAATGLAKGFGVGEARVEIFSEVNLSVHPGDFVAIVGPSGCGKSTLLHLLAGLDEPDGGSVEVGGAEWRSLAPDARARRRGETIGFVFQLHHLLPELTAEENVALPLLIAGTSEREARAAAAALLSQMGLAAKARALPRTLSGGERQRVAIARALVRRPPLLLCDEPTGSLDTAHAGEVFELLAGMARERVGAVVLVTHDPALAARASCTLHLTPHGLVGEEAAPDAR
jgi:predicted ABC-type transport system involved in lysophospholipase L1 biosynthesis ATPase subunit